MLLPQLVGRFLPMSWVSHCSLKKCVNKQTTFMPGTNLILLLNCPGILNFHLSATKGEVSTECTDDCSLPYRMPFLMVLFPFFSHRRVKTPGLLRVQQGTALHNLGVHCSPVFKTTLSYSLFPWPAFPFFPHHPVWIHFGCHEIIQLHPV